MFSFCFARGRARLSGPVLGVVAAVLLMGAVAAPAAHGSIEYGELSGANFDFFGMLEDSATDEPPLFGEPGVAGDSLFFTPVSFNAFSEGSPDITDGTFAFRLGSPEDTPIDNVLFSEAGDYTLLGDEAAVSAGLSVFGFIIEIDGVDVTPISFSQSDSVAYELPSDSPAATPWSLDVLIDFASILEGEGVDGEVTEVAFVLDNVLTDYAGDDSAALISKKLFNVTASPVPEPSTALLAIAGMLTLASARRRRA